ncbi:MAG: hypothetical protein QOC59_1544, partial [Microbacteriaceae bacterium]|nr:hypothetical protein [Microbacteriaceae bacterium]
DLGVYVVSWASFLLGLPDRLTVSGALGPTGVDVQASLILDHARGAQSVLFAGLTARTPWTATVAGSAGRVEIASPFWASSGLRVIDADGTLLADWQDPYGRPGRQGLSYQAAAAARYIGEGRTESPLHPNDEAVGVLAVLDEARHRLGYADRPEWASA